jgi:hypothetical protein
MILALPLALLASEALAENWVATPQDKYGESISIDKDSIRRGNDGLVYFTTQNEIGKSNEAADCQRGVLYSPTLYGHDDPEWRDSPYPPRPDSMRMAELKYVCANAG